METELRSLIAQVRRRWFRLVALRTTARAAVVAAIPVGAAMLADVSTRPQGWSLIALVAMATALAAAAVGLVIYRMQRRPDDRHVARFIEERAAAAPGGSRLEDEIVSAVDVSAGRGNPDAAAFKPLILAAAVRHLEAIDPRTLIDVEAMRRARVEAAGGLLLAVIIGVLAAPTLRRAGETAWIAAFPGAIHVEVLPGDARIVAGGPLQITATIRAPAAMRSRLEPALVVASGTGQRTVPMVRDGDAYRFDFESVDRSFQYRVSAGTARSAEYTISAITPARVERIDLRYHYPAFSGLPPRDEADGGDIYAPVGTKVRLRVHTDKPVKAGELSLAGAGTIALEGTAEKVLEGELTLAKDDSYRVSIIDADALRAAGDTEYFIRLMDDRPPDVRILRPSTDQQITPLEEVAIEARADDDYGISGFDLVYSVSGKPPKVVPFKRVTGTDVQRVGSYLLQAEELGVQPGDVITYYARARDVGRGKRPTETKSDMFFLEVKPFGEEFVAAQSQAGGGAAGAQIETLIAAQKEIINATWNIERRSGGGRSEADLKAVAQAQAELRARAEQMGRGPRGGRDPFPQRPAPEQPPAGRGMQAQPRAGDPIGAAIAAMTQAQQELEAKRTADAIPHEMAALNALLKAQAEVRRRQVSQQRASGSGGGGTNRTGEDLSALFDKELQRQQRTNYETRSQIEERPERKETGDSALDRIRDLARRQEELARQQRELSGGNLAAEELKRRLEKLTREQSELRQQAEELSKQQQGQSGSAMRDASEQMRGATGDMRRNDAQGAADKGQRAAEQLRRLEQQMRGGEAGGQRRDGELQVEAQQIAEAQRRIAGQAERLDRDGAAATGEARRKLAEEKERLASRVDELQRSARQAGTKGGDAAAAAEAAREMERQKIGERMREGAKQLRGGAASPAAPNEQQLARALDQVVDKLGGAGGQDRRLSDELNQTNQIRERLNRLEQQMRDAEAKQRAGGTPQPGQQGRQGQQGQQAGRGEQGRQGSGSGQGQSSELQKLREEYQRELQRARETLSRMQASQQRGGDGATPEQHEFSRSAPGTEQFKQDRSAWDSLRKDVDLALERHEAAVSARLGRKNTADRFSAGGSDRVPDQYRELIAKYFQSLASKRK